MGVNAFMSICVPRVCWCLWRPDGVRSPGTGVNAIVSCLIGVLGTEPRSYAWATTAPTHGAVSLTQFSQILTIVVWCSPACALYHIFLLYAFNHSFNKHPSALFQASAHVRLMSDYCLLLNAGLVSCVSSTRRMNGFLGRGKRWGPSQATFAQADQ